VLIYEATEDEGGAINVAAWSGADALCFSVEHDLLPFEEPIGDENDASQATVTELAGEVVARASELLGATVMRQAAGADRVRVLITIPQPRAVVSSPAPSFQSRFASGGLAAAPR